MAEEHDFVIAVDPGGNKRRVPAHYLDNPGLGFRLPPSVVNEPGEPGDGVTVTEPALPPTSARVEEPKTPKQPATGGENKEAAK